METNLKENTKKEYLKNKKLIQLKYTANKE